ncbi:SiaB family protein kinase [Methylobacter sp. Wu8]|uniref:SiaB family protein kinase n=1 Tax=Methylobacter sp. Wu8 TaxID=3118457 RepID=UPI002F30271D
MLIDVFSVFREEANTNGIVFYYSGIVSQNVIKTMSDSLKQNLQQQDEKGARSRKVFSTFIEMIQNAMHYSPSVPDAGDTKEGSILVSKKEDKYYVICANFIHKQHETRIRNKLDPILEMSAEEIRQAYRAQLKNDQHSEDTTSKGAGLGFLTLARDSVEPIEYAIRDAVGYEDELSCFYLKATI